MGRHPIHPGLAMFHGKCFSSAPGHDATTCCAQFPPRQYAGYAHGHDLGMQQTMEALLGRIPGSVTQVAMARHITTLPVRMGAYCHGLTLCTLLHQRLPHRQVVHHLSHPNAVGCLGELQESASRLDRGRVHLSSQLGYVVARRSDLDLP